MKVAFVGASFIMFLIALICGFIIKKIIDSKHVDKNKEDCKQGGVKGIIDGFGELETFMRDTTDKLGKECTVWYENKCRKGIWEKTDKTMDAIAMNLQCVSKGAPVIGLVGAIACLVCCSSSTLLIGLTKK